MGLCFLGNAADINGDISKIRYFLIRLKLQVHADSKIIEL